MNKNNNLHYYIHNIKISIHCPHNKDLGSFLEKSFFFFKKKQKYKHHLKIKINLSIKKSFLKSNKKINKIGNNVLLGEKKLIFQNHGLIYGFEIKKKTISLNVNTQTKESIFLKSKNLLKKILIKTDVYSIVRQSIILPVIWILSRKLNIHSLHGGAVSINNKGYVFTGLAGIGKSNLTLFLTLQKKFKFLSDNFLLFDKKFIYPFPEWIRITDDSKKIMPELNKFFKRQKFKRNKKEYYLLPQNKISKKVIPKIFLFMEIGNKCDLKKIKKNYAIKRILLSKDQVKEFPEHNFISLLDLLFKNEKPYVNSQLICLNNLLTNKSCFVFTINKNISIKENLDFFTKRINNV